MDIYYLKGKLNILFSLGKTADGERLPEYVLYGGDDAADDLSGGDDPAVLAGAGLWDSPATGPRPANNLCPVNAGDLSVPTSAGDRGLTLTTGRDTKLSSRVLGNLLGPEGPTTGTGTEVGDSLSSSARVAVVVNGELELLAVSAATEIG